MRTSNPMLREDILRSTDRTGTDVATARGATFKAFTLIVLTAATAAFSWVSSIQSGSYSGFILFGGIGGLIVAMITAFKPTLAPITAPIYAILEGLVLGAFSVYFETLYPGIASQAVLSTFTIFFLMLFLYQARIIKVTERFRSIVTTAIIGIALVYLVSFVLSFFAPQFSIAARGGLFGLVFTGFVIVVASFALMLDFDMIERAETFAMPKYMEWYCAFSILVTLVWLYIEVLRFLSILRSQE